MCARTSTTLETPDGGQTSDAPRRNGKGDALPCLSRNANNPALIYDSMRRGQAGVSEGPQLRSSEGRPVILFLTSRGFEPGPKSGPHEWKTLRWTGSGWQMRRPSRLPTTTTITARCTSRTRRHLAHHRAPRTLGPQAGNPGGEMVLWTSSNEGADVDEGEATHARLACAITRTRGVRCTRTRPSTRLWADGHGREPSDVLDLYFTDQRRHARLASAGEDGLGFRQARDRLVKPLLTRGFPSPRCPSGP
jgi:hypothetical protein